MKFKESVSHPGVFQHQTRVPLYACERFAISVKIFMWSKTQLLKEFELETLLMGEDDDMVKNHLSR